MPADPADLAAAVREASPPDKPTLRYAAMHLDRAANDVDGVGFQSNAADLRRVAALLRALAGIDRFRMDAAYARARWVVASYGDGQGTPQTRDIVALAGETAEDAGRALVAELATKWGYPVHLYAAGEEAPRAALLLGKVAPLHTAQP